MLAPFALHEAMPAPSPPTNESEWTVTFSLCHSQRGEEEQGCENDEVHCQTDWCSPSR